MAQRVIVRHYTNVSSYQSIIDTGIMYPSVQEKTAGGPGIYFATTEGVQNLYDQGIGYNRIMLLTIGMHPQGSLVERFAFTACYIDVQKNLLPENRPLRYWTTRFLGVPEHIYINRASIADSIGLPVNVANAIVRHGSVSKLDPINNRGTDVVPDDYGNMITVQLEEDCGRGS